MAQILAIANQKGGVGKTTTTANLGAALAEHGRRVLVVDSDPQASLTSAFGVNPGNLTASIYNVLTEEQPLSAIIQPIQGIALAPATIDLAAAELQLINEVGRERIMIDALAAVAGHYDHILIDCPPALSLLTINALTAADAVLIPVECHYLATRGLTQLCRSIAKIQRRTNPRVRLLGIVPTMYDARNSHDQDVLSTLETEFAGQVFAPIRRSIRFAESALAGCPLLTYEPNHSGAQAYRRLAEEILHGETRHNATALG